MTAVAKPETRAAPVAAPQHVERHDPLVPLEVLFTLKRGEDYTGKMELVGNPHFAVWHREFAGEVQRAQAVLDAQVRTGVTVFDITGGMNNATRVNAIGADTEDLIAVAPIVGG